MMVKENLKALRTELPEEVTLVAVSKTKPMELIQEAYDEGQRDFGENRPKELQEKAKALPKDIRWHMIGHLQRNKVKDIIEYVYLIHSVDSTGLLDVIERRAAKAKVNVSVLLQVHIAEEAHKFGFTEEALLRFFKEGKAKDYPHVTIVGLMGMATFTDDEKQLRKEFSNLKKLHEKVLELIGGNSQIFNTISMGMSGDYSIAIEEGSNMVRIGSSIFGTR
jgi:pyridoxal phosphate enzyme (YggS family)